MADAADDSHAGAAFPYLVATAAVSVVSGAALAYYNGWISGLPRAPTDEERDAIIADLLKDGADPSLDDVKKAAKRARSAVKEAAKKSKSKKYRNKPSAASDASPRKSPRSSTTASDDDDSYAAAAGQDGDDEDGSVADLLRLSALSKPKAASLAQPKERKLNVTARASTNRPVKDVSRPFVEPTPVVVVDQPLQFTQEDVAPAADEYVVPAATPAAVAAATAPADAAPEEDFAEGESVEEELEVEVTTVVVEALSPVLSQQQTSTSHELNQITTNETAAQRERIRNELQQVLNETAALRAQVEADAALIGSLRTENANLSHENQQLSREIADAKRLSAAAQNLQSEMQIIKDSNRMLAQTLSHAQLTAKDATERAARAVQTASAAEDLKATIRALELTNRDLRSQLDDVTARLEAADTRHSDNLHRSTAQAHDARKQLEARVDELVREVKTKDARHAEHKAAASRELDAQKAENRKCLGQLAETKNMAERAAREAHEQREKADPQVEELKRRVGELVAQNQASEKKAAESRAAQHEAAQAQLEELRRRVDELAAEKKAAEQKAAAAIKAEEQGQKVGEQVEDLKRRIEGLVAEKKAAEDQAAFTLRANEQSQQKANAQVEELKRRVEELVAEKEAADNKAASAIEASQRETSELDAARKAAASAGAAVEQAQAELGVLRAAAKQSAESHASELATLRADLAAAAEKISYLTAQVEASRAADVAEKQGAGNDGELESLRKERDEALETEARLKKELDATAAKIDIAVTERASMAAAEEEARIALRSALNDAKEANAAKQALEERIAALAAEVDEYKSKTSALPPTATSGPTTTAHAASASSDSNTKLYTFLWKHGGNDVRVTGAFNDWKGTVLTQHADLPTHFSVALPIPVGVKVHYKYICDGQWRVDPDAPLEKDDAFATENNIAYVA
ncbi:hypothetical protein HDU86_002012 [Geranomyces michiganensis]|nr:hypothetical protein HDU86_002012 [Geranomyces michiganensis]